MDISSLIERRTYLTQHYLLTLPTEKPEVKFTIQGYNLLVPIWFFFLRIFNFFQKIIVAVLFYNCKPFLILFETFNINHN